MRPLWSSRPSSARGPRWPRASLPDRCPHPKLSEAERARRLQERDRYEQEAAKLYRAGKLEETIAAFEKKLAIEREVLGELHEDVVDSLESLDWFQEAREDWTAARKALAEVLAIRQRQPDRKDWRIADARRAVADLDRRAAMTPEQRQRLREAERQNQLQDELRSQGKYAEGIEPCRKAMEIFAELLGVDHPDYATSLNNLAELYRAMGDYARAEPLFRQALEIRKKALGEDHPDYAASLNNLALLYQDMGDYARAEPLLRQALEINKKALGENHPDYATSLNNLAALYQAMGDYARAEPLLRQALEIRKKALGEEPPRLRHEPEQPGRRCTRTWATTPAPSRSYRQALEIKKKALGEDHPDYALGLNNLATLYQDMGDYARAEPLFRQALEIRKKALGEDHPDYATA